METQDNSSVDTENTQPIEPKKLKPRRVIWYFVGVFIVLIGAAAGFYFGSQAAIANRTAEQEKAALNIATTQFQLGLRELEEGKYENAKKRFEYVIQLFPDFPGAQQKLTEVLFAQVNVATPTQIPSPTPQPTVDLRGEEELFNQIQLLASNEDWEGVINTIESLRQLNITYHAVDVDGYYYLALRNRGVKQILSEGNLEPGIYNLALAERFAPLDDEANNYRTWARYYLTGASFWGVDWARVVQVFGEIYPSLPNLRDSSGMTAQERYRMGLIKWGDLLMVQEDWCGAAEKYEMAFALGIDEQVAPTATAAYDECHRPKETEPPPATETPTPTMTVVEGGEVTPGSGSETPTETPVTPNP